MIYTLLPALWWTGLYTLMTVLMGGFFVYEPLK